MFQGFPFDDDDDFGRRTDIRAHLDDLAARHPEFADHLLGPPWGDIPFRGSTHNNQRRGSGNGGGSSSQSSYPNYPDEDARSQASGSSATSAASGASGVSSHGEPDTSSSSSGRSQYKQSHREDRRNPIPQYGLRNTVDIGQHHRDNMENPEKDVRGQRSMSAPPENRQQTNINHGSQDHQDKHQQQPGQRYVSRVDITPQHNQQSSASQQQRSSPPPPPQSSTQQPQSNVRHIPIFVEGRDEPVISKNTHAPFQRQQSPPQFQNSPHFGKSSPFNLGFGSRQWRPHFQESFYHPHHQSFDHSPTRRNQQSPNYQQYNERQQRNEQQPSRHHQFESHQPQEHHQSRQRARPQQEPKTYPQQQQQATAPGQQAQQQEASSSKPVTKPAPPKDPLERVALVQREVDSLAEQVKQYTGNSRKDKQYIYLDEMLTRELIKLDDIETEGRENVRQARKNAIKTIQETIGLLESMAPLPGQVQVQQDQSQTVQTEQQCQEREQESRQSNEPMDVEQSNEQNVHANEAIPLPPGPSSPKAISEINENAIAVNQCDQQQNVSIENQSTKQEQEVPAVTNEEQQRPEQEQEQQQQQEQGQQEIGIVGDKSSNDNTNNINEVTMQIDDSSSTPMEVQEKVESAVEERKDENENVSNEMKLGCDGQKTMDDDKQISDSQDKVKVDKGTSKSLLSPKTVKKAKKQVKPISEKPIPLPPPQSAEANAK